MLQIAPQPNYNCKLYRVFRDTIWKPMFWSAFEIAKIPKPNSTAPGGSIGEKPGRRPIDHGTVCVCAQHSEENDFQKRFRRVTFEKTAQNFQSCSKWRAPGFKRTSRTSRRRRWMWPRGVGTTSSNTWSTKWWEKNPCTQPLHRPQSPPAHLPTSRVGLSETKQNTVNY